MNEHLNHDHYYRQLLDRITDGFIALDKNFCYTYANQKIGELVGKDPQALIGKNVWEEFPEAVNSYTYRAFQTAMKEQRFISNIDYYEPLNLWQENYIYPSPDGISVFIKDVTERKRLELELKEQEHRQQLQLVAAALQAQEKERAHIGRELHDNVNQLLTASKLILELALDDSMKATSLIRRSLTNIERAITENRRLAHELVAPEFTKENLVSQLHALAQTMLGGGQTSVTIQSDDLDEARLTPEQKLSLYRIAQEQFTNISKYAGAKSVVATLASTSNEMSMLIADDGQGTDALAMSNGIGLKNMEARLQLLEGEMTVSTEKEGGFQLQLRLPLDLPD